MSDNDELWGDQNPDPNLVQRQLRELRAWLSRPVITIRQAACLLVGYLPPERENDQRPYAGYLPPKKRWEKGEKAARELVADRIDEMQTILKELGETALKTPQGFIKVALELHIVPEWLEYACNDEATSKYLPLEAAAYKIPTSPLSGKEMAKRGGDARRDTDPKRLKFYPIVKERVILGVKPAEIIRQLDDEYGHLPENRRPSEPTIFRWAREIKEDAVRSKKKSIK
ncbi:hypothetical protein KX928_09980 [Roseobacter sp. YSTF-M11]|uniref:Uncharacterized protein n=1 Tax=Roseobacter insulae TaxID=2859783 RepID=A0A9X1FW08_9RHOB|nr:hypothetical protein [Roseobacter insulae]MBW4708115.1 hypothetical protein [Roseobacter insulae]